MPLPQGQRSFLPIFSRTFRDMTLRHYRVSLCECKRTNLRVRIVIRFFFFQRGSTRRHHASCIEPAERCLSRPADGESGRREWIERLVKPDVLVTNVTKSWAIGSRLLPRTRSPVPSTICEAPCPAGVPPHPGRSIWK